MDFVEFLVFADKYYRTHSLCKIYKCQFAVCDQRGMDCGSYSDVFEILFRMEN